MEPGCHAGNPRAKLKQKLKSRLKYVDVFLPSANKIHSPTRTVHWINLKIIHFPFILNTGYTCGLDETEHVFIHKYIPQDN